jgi:hypothetical protein
VDLKPNDDIVMIWRDSVSVDFPNGGYICLGII